MELKVNLTLKYKVEGKIPQELIEDAVLQAAFHKGGCINDEEYLSCLSNDDRLLKYNKEDFKFELLIQERHISNGR